MTRSASRGTSEKSRTRTASRRPASSVGTAAHMPRSSCRRNASISSCSSSATSGSPSARSWSPMSRLHPSRASLRRLWQRTSFGLELLPRGRSSGTGDALDAESRRPARRPRRARAGPAEATPRGHPASRDGGDAQVERHGRGTPPPSRSGCSRSRAAAPSGCSGPGIVSGAAAPSSSRSAPLSP